MKYEDAVKAGAVLSHGPMTPIEGSLPMEIPVVSDGILYIGDISRVKSMHGSLTHRQPI